MRLPRLGLGAVQFGMDYGIANDTGQVPYEDVVRILSRAREAGAALLDTSRGYGTSEETIGRALRELDAAEDFVVCTKLDLPEGAEEGDDAEVLAAVQRSIDRSRTALGLDRIPIYFLHHARHARFRDGLIWNALLDQVSAGVLGAMGISLSGRRPAEEIASLEVPSVEVVQIPFNVLDHRWRDAGFFDLARERGVAVISRSAYLKGLLAMDRSRIPGFLSDIHPFLQTVAEVARDQATDAREIALRYVLSTSAIDCTIVGVDTPEQLEDNLRIRDLPHLDSSVMERLREGIRDVPDLVLVPFLWEQFTGREDYGAGP